MRIFYLAAALSIAAGSVAAQATSDLEYARAQIAAGQTQAALAPLERILLTDPNDDQARLLYARTLYDLGDYEGAERELALLRGRLGAGQSAYAADLLAKSAARSKPFRGSGTLRTGLRYATDPTLGAGAATNEDDVTAFVGIDIRLQHEIAGTGGGAAFAEFDLRGEAHSEADAFDGFYGGLRFGLELPQADTTFVPYLTAYSDRTFDGGRQNNYGGGIALRHALSRRTEITAGVEVLERDYDNTALYSDGSAVRASFGVRYKAGPGLTLGAAIAHEALDADIVGAGYDAPELTLEAAYALPGSGLLFGRIVLIDRDYDNGRSEKIDDFFVGYSRPLTIGGLRDVSLQAGVRHERRRGTAFDGDNTSFELSLVRGFEF